MRTISEVFVANHPVEYGIPGKRLEILSAPGTVTISLRDANNIEITNGLASNLDPGSYVVPDGGFQRFQLTSSVNGTIKFLVSYGEGGTRSVAGTVTVAGTVSINGTVQVAGTVKTQEQGLQYGASWVDSTAQAINTAQTIVAPGANVNGMIVHQSVVYSINAGGIAAIIAKSAPPATPLVGDVLNGNLGGTNSAMNNPIFVPPGKGLYYISGAAETGGGYKSVLYTLL